MTFQLTEGQSIANRFTLLRRLDSGIATEKWLAEDSSLHEQIILRLIERSTEVAQALSSESINAGPPALLHPAICGVYHVDELDEFIIMASAALADFTEIAWVAADNRDQLQQLLPVLDALEYAHGLGLAHGHINENSLLLDDAGHCFLSEFGTNTKVAPYLQKSPYGGQGGDRPTTAGPADDIYALGALLYLLFTGEQWSPGTDAINAHVPLPRTITSLVQKMLSAAPYDRPASVSEVRVILEDYLDVQTDRIDISPRRIKSEDTPGRPAGDDSIPRPSAPISRRETHVISTTSAVSLLVVLLATAAIVFVFLPGKFESAPRQEVTFTDLPRTVSPQPASGASQPVREGPAPFELAMDQHLSDQANELAAQLLRQQVYLEDIGVELWAPEKYLLVQGKGDAGDTNFRDGDYQAAIDHFNDGLVMLSELESMSDSVRERSIREGQAALMAGQADPATRAFTIVMALDPGNPVATMGLIRAETLAEVFEMVTRAGDLEGAQELEAALEVYVAASSIDPEMAAATDGERRIRGKIQERDFNDAMSAGFRSLKLDDYERAGHHFEQAQRIRPDSPAPADGLNQIEIAVRLQQIEQYRGQAALYEQGEKWHEAEQEYAAVLGLDPGLLFAVEGRRQAEVLATAHDQIDQYLDGPALLSDPSNLELAKALFSRAKDLNPMGMSLSQKLSRLDRLITLARTPVQVQIRSDNSTEVTVYRVRKLGRIETTTLTLYPGTYRVLGTRRGYRDVNEEFTLVAGQTPPIVSVTCTEKI